MFKTIIIDDEPHCIDALESKLLNYSKDIAIADTCHSVKEGIDSIRKNNPDLIFLDINMPKEDGFSLLEQLPTANFEIIFTTAYDKYAVKAFEFSALHFLLKPIDDENLGKAISRFKERRMNTSLNQINALMEHIRKKDHALEKIALPTTSGFSFIELKEIIRLQAESNYTQFHLKDGSKVIVPKTLKEYEKMLLEDSFARIHKSHLINLQHVKTYKKSDGIVTMSDGSEIEVSARKKADFLKELGRFMKV